MPINVKDSRFKKVGTAIHTETSQVPDINIDNTDFEQVGKVIHAEPQSVSRQLGIEGAPPELLLKFFEALKENPSPVEAAKKSRLDKWLSQRNITLASFALNAVALIRSLHLS